MNKPYEVRPNTGSVFKNENKSEPRTVKSSSGDTYTIEDADYKGSGLIGDTEYWIDARLKTAKSGKKYLALKFNPKQVQAKKAAPAGGLTEDNWSNADLNDPLGF